MTILTRDFVTCVLSTYKKKTIWPNYQQKKSVFVSFDKLSERFVLVLWSDGARPSYDND